MSNKGFHILINESSGGVAGLGPAALKSLVDQTEIDVAVFECLSPEQFFEKLLHYKDNEHPLLIGGGDGTLKSCAEMLMEHKRAFGVIPLGTMNLLARDLNIPTEIDEALNAYAKGYKKMSIDVGVVNDEIFLCCVGLGTMPEASEFREEHRSESDTILIPRLTAFTLHQMDRQNQRKIRINIDGKSGRIKTSALVVSSNQYGPQNEWHGNNFKRKSLQDGKLGVYSAAPITLWDKLRLLVKLLIGNWKKDPVIKEWLAREVRLTTEKSEELLSLDGETKRFKTPLRFYMKPQSLDVLVPVEGN